MKPQFPNPALPWLMACLICSPPPLIAQTPVTGVFTHFVTATGPTAATLYTGSFATGNSASTLPVATYIYRFGTNISTTNNTEILDSFVATGLNYHFQPATPLVRFRRVNNASTVGLRKSLWFEENTTKQTATNMASVPPYDDSLERIFSGQIYNIGIDNNFQNSTNTNNGNIERVDVIFTGGITATTDLTKLGFVVFDRGSGGSHDPFVIAAIKTLDASGNPDSYYNAVSVGASNYGNVPATSIPFNIFRKNPADAHLLIQTLNSAQQRDGVFLSFSALGIPGFTNSVYGYSLFSTDANTSSSANMVNYAAFPTNTDLGSGGLDQVAVTGVAVTKANFIVLADYMGGFNAALSSNGQVSLGWTLHIVDDVQHAVLERSGNGTDFIPLRVYSDLSKGYQTAVDDRPLPDVNYYRLRLEARDGKILTYSPVRAVTVGAAGALAVSLYPSPVKNKRFTLDIRGLRQDIYDCRIFDMNGNAISASQLQAGPLFSTEIYLPHDLPAGMYMILLSDRSGRKRMTKIFSVE